MTEDDILELYIEKFVTLDIDSGFPRRGLDKIGLPNWTTYRELLTALFKYPYYEVGAALHYGITRNTNNPVLVGSKSPSHKGFIGSMAKRKGLWQSLGKDNNKAWRAHIFTSVGYNHCSSCDKILPLSHFDNLVTEKTSKKYASEKVYRNICKPCYLEYMKPLTQDYKKRNPHVVNELSARRRAAVKNQTPDLSADEVKELRALYKEAKKRSLEEGIQYHVDHIKPIHEGGLHHPSNLQIIPASENLSKSSKWTEEIADKYNIEF